MIHIPERTMPTNEELTATIDTLRHALREAARYIGPANASGAEAVTTMSASASPLSSSRH